MGGWGGLVLDDGVTARLECDDGKLAGWNRGRSGSFAGLSELSCRSNLRRRDDCGDEVLPFAFLPAVGGRRKDWRSEAMVER